MDDFKKVFAPYKCWRYDLPQIVYVGVERWKIVGKVHIREQTKTSVRIDWDKVRGPHLSVTRSSSKDEEFQQTVRFKNPECPLRSRIRVTNTKASILRTLTQLRKNPLCYQEYGRLLAHFPEYLDEY